MIDNRHAEAGSKYAVFDESSWQIFSTEKSYLNYCFKSHYQLDNLSVIKYLYSDNLCNRFIFAGFFVNSIRVPSGITLLLNSESGIKVQKTFLAASNAEFANTSLLNLIQDRSKNLDSAALLFSGGLDSALIKSVDTKRQSFHLDYHGMHSRTGIIIRKFKGMWPNISVVDQKPYLSSETIKPYLCCGIGAFGSLEQLSYQTALSEKLNSYKIDRVITGQNADTLLCVDHYLPATQETGIRRYIKFKRSNRLRKNILNFSPVWSVDDFLKKAGNMPGLFGFGEHKGKSVNLSESTLKEIYAREVAEYQEIAKNVLHGGNSVHFLKMTKILRWFRTCTNAVDNYKNAYHATGIKRILFYISTEIMTRLINSSESEVTPRKPKFLLEEAFKNRTGRDFRFMIEIWILLSSGRLLWNKLRFFRKRDKFRVNIDVLMSNLVDVDEFKDFYRVRLQSNSIRNEILNNLTSIQADTKLQNLDVAQLRLLILYLTCCQDDE